MIAGGLRTRVVSGEDLAPPGEDVGILVPARDEEASLPWLLEALACAAPAARVLVVDNGSADGTAAAAKAGGARLVSEPRAGYGRACRAGLRAFESEERPPEVVVFLDADDHRAPSQLGPLLAPIRAGRADLVVGERRAAEGPGVRAHAALGNRLVTATLAGLYGSTVRDMGPFRAVRRECLRILALDEPDYGWYVQMQVRALRCGFRVVGVPIAFERRRRGRSKISGSWLASARAGRVMLRTLAREVVREPPERRPYASDRRRI